MTIHNLPRAEKSIDVSYLAKYGIQAYDRDNLYPQNVMKIVSQSKNGTGCLSRYKDFVEGDGLADQIVASFVINPDGETFDDLHSLCASDVCTFNGFAIHVNYNIDAKIINAHFIPFENVRLCEPDADGVIKKVAIHPDWTGQSTRDGKKLAVNEETIDYIDVFNPDPIVVSQQIMEAGGIQFFKGQVLYVSTAGYLRYPLAKFDSVLTDMSTDEGVSNVMLRNARNNFLPAGFFVHYKGQGQPVGLDEDIDPTYPIGADDEYSDVLGQLQGDMASNKILDLTVESKDEIPEFVKFDIQNLDAAFTVTTDKIEDNIYSQFGQEAFLSLRRGKVGFSGQMMSDATDDYARRCRKIQRLLSRNYYILLQNWSKEYFPTEVSIQSTEITPISYSVNSVQA